MPGRPPNRGLGRLSPRRSSASSRPMPPEVIGHLFEPFSRGPDEKSRKASGLGLGLYIAREIVRGHGGEIHASSDGESVVTVRLPRRAA